ncbi:MAG: sulfotransferase [Pseudomonadota bacterium]
MQPEFLFVVGIGRSGTSLLQNMLAGHSAISFLPESSFLRRYAFSRAFDKGVGAGDLPAFAKTLADDVAFKRLGFSAEQVQEMLASPEGGRGAGFFRRAAYRFGPPTQGAVYLGDKDPRLIEYLPSLKAAFPSAKVVHIYRDPRDVFLSKSRADWAKGRTAFAYAFAGRVQWELVRRTGEALFGENFYELAYERLIDSPDEEMSKLCRFLSLSLEPAMLHPSEGGGALVAKDELAWKKETLGPILAANTGKWRTGLAPSQIVLVERISRRLMRDVGYETSSLAGDLDPIARASISLQALAANLLSTVYCRLRLWSQHT